MINRINNLRAKYQRNPANVDWLQNDWCTAHCEAMAKQGDVFHAMPSYLNDWGEIVAQCWQFQDWNQCLDALINLIESSDDHRDILLNSERIGYGLKTANGKTYLTIRGK